MFFYSLYSNKNHETNLHFFLFIIALVLSLSLNIYILLLVFRKKCNMSHRKRIKKDVSLITDRHYRRIVESEKKQRCSQIFSSLNNIPSKANNIFIHTDESFSDELLINSSNKEGNRESETLQIIQLHHMLLKTHNQLFILMKI